MLTQERRRWVLVSGLLVFGLVATASKASTIAADNLTATFTFSSFDYGIGFAGSGFSGPFSNETPAQEFTALVSGTVTSLTATVQQVRPQGLPLNISIFASKSGLPGTRLVTVSFAQAQVSSSVHSNLSMFDLSTANVSLTAGQSYFVVFSVVTPIDGNARYESVLLQPNAHSLGFPAIVSPDGGTNWLSPVISDEIGVTMLVNQTTVPEPSPIGLAAMSVGSLVLLGRRKKA